MVGRISPRTVDGQGSLNVIAAAEQSATEVVMLSIAGASATSPLELARVKYGVEEHLRTSLCPWTVVRADAFAQTWFNVLEQTAVKSHRPMVFGDGNNLIGWVDVHEVAALVEHAVLEPSLRGRILEISGPEPLTLEQLATLLMEHHGWPGKPRRLPRSVLRVIATMAAPVRPDIARQARASLAMDVLAQVDDHETRAAFPDLPAVPVSWLLTQTA
ncbi:MAG: NmrA family NAD(P)-binding protein [Nocardioidaceae bacterium]|nr:NmrA family NAD(P)-binding protein [Nocardioidaceae bacterium]